MRNIFIRNKRIYKKLTGIISDTIFTVSLIGFCFGDLNYLEINMNFNTQICQIHFRSAIPSDQRPHNIQLFEHLY